MNTYLDRLSLHRRSDPAQADDYLDLGSVAAAVRRQTLLVLTFALAGAFLAVAYILASDAKFTAVETILINETSPELPSEVSPMPSVIRSDSSVQSEIEIIKSQALALRVIDALNLTSEETFMDPRTSLIDDAKAAARRAVRWAFGLISPGGSTGEAAADGDLALTPREIAANALRRNLDVTRIGRSYVLEMAYTGSDAARAAQIARTYGQEYTAFQLGANISAAEVASEWLSRRLEQLEAKSFEAARKLRDFRAEHGLVAIRGELLTDQQISELATQLIAAERISAGAKARLDQLEGLLSESPSAMITTTLSLSDLGDLERDSVLVELRERYIAAEGRLERVVQRWGAEHDEARRLGEILQETERQIVAAIRQARAAARAEHQAVLGEEAALRSALGRLIGDTDVASEQLGKLRQLETVAATYSELYADFLRHFETLAQQPAYPIVPVRILSQAEVPKHASSPNKAMFLAVGIILGALLGMVVGAFRELREQPLRTADELRGRLGAECPGLLPATAARAGRSRASRVAERTLDLAAEGIDLAASKQYGAIVGIVPVASEDAHAFAEGLSRHLIRSGRDVLVIDARRDLPEDTARGDDLSAADGDAVRYSGTLRTYAPSHVLRLGAAGEDGLWALDRRTLESYHIVLCILPALTDGTDAERFAARSDAMIVLARWGKIRPALLRGALEANRCIASRLAGVVLVDARLGAARRFTRRGSFDEAVIAA